MRVDAQRIGKKLHRLEILVDGQRIGEYERSQAADIERKTAEINCATDYLFRIYRRHGEFKVRWSGSRREKIVYVDDLEVGSVLKACWRKPSWVE